MKKILLLLIIFICSLQNTFAYNTYSPIYNSINGQYIKADILSANKVCEELGEVLVSYIPGTDITWYYSYYNGTTWILDQYNFFTPIASITCDVESLTETGTYTNINNTGSINIINSQKDIFTKDFLIDFYTIQLVIIILLIGFKFFMVFGNQDFKFFK